MDVFISVTIGLVVLNVIYNLLPDSSYNKYLRFTAGILFLIFVTENICNIKIESNFFNFEEEMTLYDNSEYRETVNKQLEETISGTVVRKIEQELNLKVNVKTVVENNEIVSLEIGCPQNFEIEKIKNLLTHTYNLDEGRITFNQ